MRKLRTLAMMAMAGALITHPAYACGGHSSGPSQVSGAADSGATCAVATERYSKVKFDEAVKSGKSIVVNSWASWCPVCARQWPVLEKVMNEGEFNDFAAFWIDFDKDKSALKDLKIPSQSNIKVYKAGTEVGWEIGQTNPDQIRTLLRKAK